jgi:glycosyltransferase involved in cell wall biosynthesis
MKILYIGIYAEKDLIELVNKNSISSSQIAISAIKYSKFIAEGLNSLYPDSTNLFLVPLGMFPSCKIILFKNNDQSNNIYIPYINLILIKQLCISIYIFYFTLVWYLKNIKEKKYIFFGFLYFPFLLPMIPFKFFFNVKIISFVPDLPKYIFTYTNANHNFKTLLIPLLVFITNILSKMNDYLIFITKYMSLQFPNKKHFIIEGFTDINLKNNIKDDFIENKNAIMYAGALFEKFGIKTLLDAFSEISNNYELWLFGFGDLTDYITDQSKKDNRIKFFGNLPNDIVLDYEKKARLLINPRPLNHEFTKNSFPSKILEYMTSGTPVLTTKLPGIPDDYSDKLFFFDDDTKFSIKNGIINYMNKSDCELYNYGKKSKEYAIKEKNNIKQITNLISFIKKDEKINNFA